MTASGAGGHELRDGGATSRALVILGAGGFVGRAVIGLVDHSLPVKAVVCSVSSTDRPIPAGVTWKEADLSRPGWEETVLEPGDVVVNLADVSSAGEEKSLQLIDSIIRGCQMRRVERLLHCSTAAVVGTASSHRVTEATTCEPLTPYERTK